MSWWRRHVLGMGSECEGKHGLIVPADVAARRGRIDSVAALASQLTQASLAGFWPLESRLHLLSIPTSPAGQDYQRCCSRQGGWLPQSCDIAGEQKQT